MRSLSELIKARNRANKNALVIFTGETGVGKSYAALDLAEKVDEYFTSRKIFFSFEPLLKYIKRNSRCTVIYDDAGVTIFSRNWMSLTNKLFSLVAQSFRFKLINLFFTVPSLGMIDKNAHRLCHYIVDMRDRGKGMLFRIMDFRLGNKTSFSPLGEIYFDYPSEMLAEQYERKRKAHLQKLYSNFTQSMKKKRRGRAKAAAE